MNDLHVTIYIMVVFVTLGTVLPFVNEGFGQGTTSVDMQNLEASVSIDTGSEAALSGFTIITSILSMFFWTFGELPFWLDSFLIILRVVFVYSLIRLVRGVG